jgi:hypothetical protein
MDEARCTSVAGAGGGGGRGLGNTRLVEDRTDVVTDLTDVVTDGVDRPDLTVVACGRATGFAARGRDGRGMSCKKNCRAVFNTLKR